VDGIPGSSPSPTPTNPDIGQDSLAAFWTNHDVKSQSELMGRSTRGSHREGLNGIRNFTSQDSLSKLEENRLCTYRTSS